MRERSTWNRESILKRAAVNKKADPYTMNQDHPQPAMDKYVNGNPSQWAEDVHKPDDWKAEYSGDAVKRNEIGMGEMRPETFTHKEKTASEELLVKKADLCVKLAKAFLPKTASESVIEDQAVAFMELSDTSLIDSFSRLAQDQAEQQAPAQQDEKQAQAQQEQQAPAQEDKSATALVQAIQSPEFKTAFKKLFAQEMQQQSQGQQDEKQAQQDQSQQQAPAQEEPKQAAPVAPIAAPVAAPIAAPFAQQQQQMMPPPAQQEMMADDALLDEMLASPDMMAPPGDAGMVGDIEMGDSSGMDFDDSGLGPEDADLQALFAQDPEAQDAAWAQGQQAKQAAVRTASTRTLGTKPSAGVSRIGTISPATKTAGAEDKLSSLWASAPDVREHFGQR